MGAWGRAVVGAGLAVMLAGVTAGTASGGETAPAQPAARGAQVASLSPVPGGGGGEVAADGTVTLEDGSYDVTLITGDRVQVTQRDGRTSVAVTAATRADGSRPSFQRYSWKGHHFVVPVDVAALVPAQLDRRLFDVTGLIASGYDDARTDSVPVIVQTGEPGTKADPARGVDWKGLGVAKGRSLKSIGSVAGKVSKEQGGGHLVEALADVPAVKRVWLDARVEALDAVSTPQVGAPQAWDAGFTGEGVTVAVLDTGVDAEHPDLADAVVDAADFSESESGPDDLFGHGTHVAGIITGNGAASDGEILGVAPDAKILNGKVLDDTGSGSDSMIIAGMEWAAAEGADVVNMSLGLPGGYTDGTDPLALAVNEISEASGILFVIAAGNEGGYTTVTTPGSADLALTVAAVDAADVPTWFTSRGPRIDGAAKPDLAAPGEEILAPNAGYPDTVNEPYISYSGTSMATPHVAGVAALLLDARPDLGTQELKSILVGSAEDVSASVNLDGSPVSVFDVGAGRVFTPNAIDQQVYATPSSLGFGVFAYPQTDAEPVTETLTYTNTAAVDLTLTLTAETTGEDGSVLPGAASLSVDEVTVPAGGSAQVDVTFDPQEAGLAAGRVGGVIVASDGAGQTVRTVVMAVNEPEMYDLTIVGTDRNGGPGSFEDIIGVTPLGEQEVFNFDQLFPFFGEDGVATVRLPVGMYGVMGTLSVLNEETWEFSVLDAVNVPEVELIADTTVYLDATQFEPVTVRTQRPSQQVSVDYTLTRMGAMQGVSVGVSVSGGLSLGAVPSEPVTVGEFSWMHKHLRIPPRAGLDAGDYRYLYDLAWYEADRISGGGAHVADSRTTSRTTADYNSMAGGPATAWSARFAFGPADLSAFATAYPVALPIEREEYTNGDPQLQWSAILDPFDGYGLLESPSRSFVAGTRQAERWLHQVHHLSTVRGMTGSDGESLMVMAPSIADDHGHLGYADSTILSERTRVWVDGALVDDQPFTGAFVPAPELGTRVRVLSEVSVSHPAWTRSTSYSTDWRFRAPAGSWDEIVPVDLLNVDYGVIPQMSDLNATGRSVRLNLAILDAVGERASGVRSVKAWVSGDRGRTWSEAKVSGTGSQRSITVQAPKGAVSVSLKVTARTARATVTDTVLDAVGLR